MKISIRKKIILIMLTVIIISITFIEILAFNNAKAIILNEVKQSNFKTLENANDYFLRKFMLDMEHVVNYWAEDEEIKNYRNKPNQPKMVRTIPNHFKDIADQWMGYVKGSPYIAWIYLGPEEDGSLFITPLDETMPEDYDCRTRSWYKKAVQNRGKTVWSDPYLDAGEIGGIVVTVARAVENENGLLGAVGMDIKISRFSDMINDIRFGDEGYIMLMNSRGEIFSHPDKEMILFNAYDDEELAEQLIYESGNEFFNYKGKQSIISYLTVPETGWKLVGIMPFDMEATLAPIKNKAIQAAMISILITFFIALFLSQVITKPLKNIMKVINSISKGKLNEHIVIQSNDEFGILGDQFNNMLDTLRGLIEERNLNVEELTKMNEEILVQSEKIRAYSEEKEFMNKELRGLLEEIKNSYLSTVLSLANAIEANDKYTRGHCERVSNISIAIAKSMGVGVKDLNTLEIASILHDIGKIGISSAILNKEGKLTKEEFDVIKKHPKIGHDILSDVEFLYESRKIILQHHERIDGKGYPQGLKGQNIIFLSRIMAVADAYDAMTSSRPYRKIPLTKEQAIDEMIRAKGTQFDEQVVDCLVNLLMVSSMTL